MKRFVVAAAVAVALGLGYSAKADAQIVFSHSVPNGSGRVMGGSFVMPGGFMFSPSPQGVMIQPSVRPLGFNQFNGFNPFNPFTGMSFRNNFSVPNQFHFSQPSVFQPMTFGTPFGGFGMNNWHPGGFGMNSWHMGHWHR